jgi:diadenosine tetraphosphatase ApaH/serine/threonine PP2A family protein phosphatase
MRMALLADVHANLEAFRACLEHAQEQRVDRYVFLGDLVGYGADPAPVVESVIRSVAQGAVAVLGNHDQAVAVGPSASMTAEASQAIKWTRAQLTAAELAFLGALPMTVEQGGCLYVHANAWDPGGWEYLTSSQDVGRSLAATHCRQTFCGHVHNPALYHLSPGGTVSHFDPVAGTGIPLGTRRRWLAIAGSVGQPRDGIPAASYATFDDQGDVLTFFRVPYDTAEAARKVRAAGLPEALGRRIEAGG